ncbi:MAG TPA: DNA glycosylase, partial [Methanomicrobiales archaeon]|nr:DNA glycosylase [Methanomicrobiales archaeon]
RLRQEGDRLSYDGTTAGAVRRYLALDEDLPTILSSFDRDPVIHRSVQDCRGLRILRQDPWEILASFICATNTNIPRIRKMIATLAPCFGTWVPRAMEPAYSFPEPAALSGPSCTHLKPCRLGYRDRYIAETAARVAADPGILGRIAGLPFPEARSALLSFPGVGPKAAECILLFGFHRLEAFPVDVWIRRIMYTHYLHPPPESKGPSEREDRRIREFGRKYFGKYAGYAQEYLFCAREELGRGTLRSPGSSSSGIRPAPR